MNKTLNYISYQSFPAETANSLQTISNLKYLNRNNYKINLYFPLREKSSSDNLDTLKDYYLFDEDINVKGLDHPYPFGKIKYFQKIFFHISHYLWAKSITKKFDYENYKDEYFFTRSDWILYFLAKRKFNIIFECHQYSKVRSFVFKKVANYKNVKIIFLNELIKNEFKNPFSKYSILPSAVDFDIFNNYDVEKIENKITFVGNLLRFGNERNLDIIFRAFSTPELQKYHLTIVGGPDSEVTKITSYLKNNNISNIEMTGRLGRKEVVEELLSSSIGLLINSSDKHSKFFTSPLKYFEYLAAGLRVVAIDFPSHKILPNQENIYYFNNNQDSLIKAVKEAFNADFKDIEKDKISLETRANEIIKLFED